MRCKTYVLLLLLFTFLNLCFSQTQVDKAGRIFIDEPGKQMEIDQTRPQYKITFVHDFVQFFVWASTPYTDLFFTNNEIYLPGGTYNLIFEDFPTRCIVKMIAMENVVVSKDTTINVSHYMAEHSNEYSFRRENGDTLHMHAFGKYMTNIHTGLRLLTRCYHMDTTSIIWKYNFLPADFHADWAVKGKPHSIHGRKLYLLNNRAIYPGKDTLITNDPQNYAFGHLHYFFPDSIEKYRQLHFGIFNPGFHWYNNDPTHYAIPHDQEVYQDTTGGEALYGAYFHTTVKLYFIRGRALVSPEMRILEDKIISYISRTEHDFPIPISYNQEVELGQCPTFFHAGFENSAYQIKFSGIYNHKLLEQPFLSMTNDALRHIPYHFQVKQGNNIIHSANLAPDDTFYIYYGYDPEDMKVTVPTNKYTVTLSDTHSVVGELEASTIVDFELDLRQKDKNPPRMRSFQLWTEQFFNPTTARISSKLYKYNKNYLKFILNDSSGVSSVGLSITNFHTGELIPIPVQENYPYYHADFPDLEHGYYSLSLKVSDPSGNKFTSLMKPAFCYLDVNHLDEYKNRVPKKFTLQQNYPNPFNASTKIRVQTKNQNADNLKLIIYDIQGRVVRRLEIQDRKKGSIVFSWNGKNENGKIAATGIYFGKLEGGDSSGTIKMLHVR